MEIIIREIYKCYYERKNSELRSLGCSRQRKTGTNPSLFFFFRTQVTETRYIVIEYSRKKQWLLWKGVTNNESNRFIEKPWS